MQVGIGKGRAAGLVDHLGRSFTGFVERVTAAKLHPLDDPREWARQPAYDPPRDVDIAAEQKKIDEIYGTDANGQSIMKLVWTGDREYWFQFYTEWNALGHPTAEPQRSPLIRYQTLHDSNGKKIRDTFPARWLLLSRIAKSQYENDWKQYSYVYAPELSGVQEYDLGNGQTRLEARPVYKQIRPDEPPPALWLWYATIKDCNGQCCVSARKSGRVCYGKYAPPAAIHETLYHQRRADEAQGYRPFEKLNYSTIREIEDAYSGYQQELRELKAHAEIFIANPMALIGLAAAERAGIDTDAKARKVVKEFFDRNMDRVGSKI